MHRIFSKNTANNADALIRALQYCYSLLTPTNSDSIDSLSRLLRISNFKSAKYFKEYLPLVDGIIEFYNKTRWGESKIKANNKFKKAFAMMLANFSTLKPDAKLPTSVLLQFDKLLKKLVEDRGSNDLLKGMVTIQYPASSLFNDKVNLSQLELVHTDLEKLKWPLEVLCWGLASFFEQALIVQHLGPPQTRNAALKALPAQSNLYFSLLPHDIMKMVVVNVRASEAQNKPRAI